MKKGKPTPKRNKWDNPFYKTAHIKNLPDNSVSMPIFPTFPKGWDDVDLHDKRQKWSKVK